MSPNLGGTVEKGLVSGESMSRPPAVVAIGHHRDEVQVDSKAGMKDPMKEPEALMVFKYQEHQRRKDAWQRDRRRPQWPPQPPQQR